MIVVRKMVRLIKKMIEKNVIFKKSGLHYQSF
jgi:hypothetical protein